MKRSYDSMSSSIEISSYRDQHFKVAFQVPLQSLIPRQKIIIIVYCYYFNFFIQGSRSEQEKLLRASSTLYIGNLSFYTTEEQIYDLFSRCGDIRRVIMGLDKYKKTPCGFCFVEYYARADAENCMRLVWISIYSNHVKSMSICYNKI